MALAVANRSGGKTSERGLYDFIGSSTTGSVVSGFAVRENSPLGMSVRIGGIAGTRDTLLIRDGLNTQVVFTDDGQPVTASVSPAHASLYRIDRVVVYIDKAVGRSTTVLDNNNGVVKVMAVAGNPDSQANAVPPTNAMIQSAIRSTNKWTVLGDLTVAPGVTQVTQSAVADRHEMAKLQTQSAMLTKSVDANGWTVLDNGVWKTYIKRTGSVSIDSGLTGSVTTDNFPVGMDRAAVSVCAITATPMQEDSRGFGSNLIGFTVLTGNDTAIRVTIRNNNASGGWFVGRATVVIQPL